MNDRSKIRPNLIRTDMTPMIDVIFLLLVFFLYAVMHMAEIKGVKLALPKVVKAEIVVSSPLAIVITAEGQVAVEDTPVEPEHLVNVVTARLAGTPQRGILLQADRDSRTGLTVSVMSRLKNAGYESVTLAVEKEMP